MRYFMAITSNSIQNNQNRSGNLNTNSAKRAYRTNGGTIQVREGETLKGVVSDIHGNEITISMDDGSSFTGKLPEASQYSIGQKAAFQITGLDNGTIYMKAISQAYLLGMEDTIEQALEEAGLPKSPRNLEIVRSLLENQQSISRENILNSLQLCAKYPKADVNTVISMKCLGMPMDPATVTQFDNYQKQSHQLLYRMESLTSSVNDLLADLVNENPSIARYAATEMLNIALNSLPSLEEFNLAAQLAETDPENANPELLKLIQPNSADSQQTAPAASGNEPVNTAKSNDVADSADAASPEKTPGLADADSSLKKSSDANTSPFARMKQLFTNMTDRASGGQAATEKNVPFIHEQTGHILSTEERSELAELLGRFTENKKMLSSLESGILTTRELLTNIRQILPSLSDEDLFGLLTSKNFGKLIKGQFLSGWTLSPEGLKEGNGVEQLYGKLQEQLSDLTNLSRMFATRTPGEAIVNTTMDMQQNMEFMKMLGEHFAYMQLPVKLSEENAHGDLYVMTKKDALRRSKDNLKVLLHLEMDYLGTLDIHITKEHTSISTKFYVEKEAARKLLEKNANLLKDAINEQGYSFTSEFTEKEKDVDLIHDFMEKDAPTPVGNVTRYNFDLRA